MAAFASHLCLDLRGAEAHCHRVDDRPVTLERQLADLAELKAATERRHTLRRGTPEWTAAVHIELEIIDRVRRWSQPADRR